MKSKLVSVIIPLYNREEYIGEALESILNQTYKNLEILVVDDYSTDNGVLVVKRYKDKRIKIIENSKNMGIAYTRNIGFDNARGEYIALLDSDDIALLDRIEKQVKFLENNPDIYLLGGNRENFNSKKTLDRSNHGTSTDELKVNLLFDMDFTNPTVMFRSSIINEFKQDSYFKVAQDYDFISRVSKVYKVANLSDVLIKYRLHESQITQNVKRDAYLEKIRSRIFNDIDVPKELHRAYYTGISYKANSKDISDFLEVILLILRQNKELKLYSEKVLKEKLMKKLSRCVRRNLRGTEGLKVQKNIRQKLKQNNLNLEDYTLRITFNSFRK